MNFWNLLRWIALAIFLVLIVLSLVFGNPNFSLSGGSAEDAPRPAPVIVH
jgi:hypothetical protein